MKYTKSQAIDLLKRGEAQFEVLSPDLVDMLKYIDNDGGVYAVSHRYITFNDGRLFTRENPASDLPIIKLSDIVEDETLYKNCFNIINPSELVEILGCVEMRNISCEQDHRRKLLSVDEVGIIAVNVAEMIDPSLSAQEQVFFIAGFHECAKWIRSNSR